MNHTKLKDFLYTKLLDGYSVEFADFTQQDMGYLQELANETSNDNLVEIKELFGLMTLYVDIAKRKDDFNYIWDDFWGLSGKISNYVTISWYDPDTSYEEDIMARYDAIKSYIEEN